MATSIKVKTAKNNLFLFFGEDTFQSTQTLKRWKEKFAEKYEGDINLTELTGGKLTPGDIKQAFQTVPFLSEKRLVIVRDFFALSKTEILKQTSSFLDELPEFCILVFVEEGFPDKRTSLYKYIQKNGDLKEFPLLTGSALLQWINKRARELGTQVDDSATLLLADIIGGDLWRMDSELKKLISYTKGELISRENVDLLVDTTLTTSIFTLTDAIARKDKKKSLKELHTLINSGEELHMILHMIVRQFRLIIQIKDFAEQQRLSQYEITSKLKQHPFVVQKTLQQISNFSIEQLKQIYRALLEIDTGLKTGKIKTFVNDTRELVLALDQLVLNTCN